jgi:hypothetical protein
MTLEQQVERCLQKYPNTRNNDTTLLIAVWRDYYGIIDDVIYLHEFYVLPTDSSINRIRRRFNSQGKYYPTDWAIAKQRGITENEWRLRLGYPLKGEAIHPSAKKSYMDNECITAMDK